MKKCPIFVAAIEVFKAAAGTDMYHPTTKLQTECTRSKCAWWNERASCCGVRSEEGK